MISGTIKKTFKALLFTVLLFFVSTITWIVLRGFQLSLFRNFDNLKAIELTSGQKADDIRYFYDFVQNSYPFSDAIVQEKGMEDFFSTESEYLRRAEQSKNNKEFVELFSELIQRLEQGTGHSDIIGPPRNNSNVYVWLRSLGYGISKESHFYQKYWWDLLDINSKYTHSDLLVHYRNGEYILAEEFVQGEIRLPQGSSIAKIDEVPVDAYVKSLQHKIWLRFDAKLKRPFSFHPSPFCVAGDTAKKSWNVEFKEPDGNAVSCSIVKMAGDEAIRKYIQPDKNVICIGLTDSVAYLRVNNLLDHSFVDRDLSVMKDFFAAGNYHKLIIDLRWNTGGSPSYGEELLIRPFLTDTMEYVQYAAVKKKIYNKIKLNSYFVKHDGENFSWGKTDRVDLDEIDELTVPGYISSSEFFFFRDTKQFTPNTILNFNGEVSYLIDNDCFSATEDVIRVVKKLKIGPLIGMNSSGGAAVVLPTWIFELPNSHILYMLEIEAAFNPDGTINEIYGTKPDIEIEASTFPTSFPAGFTKEHLLNDPWIRKLLEN